MDGLSRLQKQPNGEVPVRVVGLDNLKCISGVAVDIDEWGCRIRGDDIPKLHKQVAIQFDDEVDMTRAEVTAVEGCEAFVRFNRAEVKGPDQRREPRNNVQLMVKVFDPENGTEVSGTIIDAGKNGCRIKAEGLAGFPERVMLSMSKINAPVPAKFVWRTEAQGGLRLCWEAVSTSE